MSSVGRGRRVVLGALSVLLVGVVFAQKPAEPDALVIARDALARKDYATARDRAAAFLADPQHTQSPLRPEALFLHGRACFFLGDHVAAGRSLNQLAPFTAHDFDRQARFLLARVHHLTEERNEAALHYAALVADREAPPDLVARASYCLGVLRFEDGNLSDARERFNSVTGPLADDARLCRGMCEVQAGEFAEAVRTLQPLADKKSLAAAARLWLGKAQLGLARGDDPERPTFAQAIQTLTRAEQTADNDRLAETLVEIASAHQLAGQHRDAAAVYQRLLDKRLLPRRDEELMQGQATALTLAASYQESERVCEDFLKKHPRSPLTAGVLFLRAENASLLGRDEEAVLRYRQLIEKFPEFEQVHHARHALALVHFRMGEFEKARDAWESVPASERRDDLATVAFHLGDCHLRLAPKAADDALAAGRLREQLEKAAELFGEFVAADPESPHAPDALLRLGYVHRRLADLLADGDEKNQHHEADRVSFESVLLDYPGCDQQPHALLERAKWFGRNGAHDEALAKLQRFTAGSLRDHPLAPLALLQSAAWLRAQGKPAEAEQMLARCRQRYEKALLADASRSDWVPFLWFQHAVALGEAGRAGEGCALLEKLRKDHSDHPASREVALRLAQLRGLEAMQKISQANEALGNPELKEPDAARLRQAIQDQEQKIRDLVASVVEEARRLGKQKPGDEVAARLLYQAAWVYRNDGEGEVNAAWDKLREKLRRDVSRTEVELQPSEKKARELYRELIENYADLPLVASVRLELAETLADRGDFEGAIKLLIEALDQESSADLTDRIRLRLGVCQENRGDLAAALRQFEVLAARRESGWAVHGLARAAEVRMQKTEWDEAVKLFAVFRDEKAFQGVGGWSDRGLLRLGHALVRLGRWDDAHQAFDLLPERFGDSGWVPAARYGRGWALLRQKKYAEAQASFAQALGAEPNPVGDRARVAGYICEIEQKKYKEAIEGLPSLAEKASEPEVKAFALLEAAYAATEIGQRDLAMTLLKRVVVEFAETPWAATAKERLTPKAGQMAPHTLPAAESLLTPDLAEPLGLERLGHQQDDWVPADDPSDDASLAAVLARVPAGRKVSFATPPRGSTDPFEFRDMMRGRIPPDVDHLPAGRNP